MLQNILKIPKKAQQDGVICAVMAPTHELAEQITQVFLDFTTDLDISVLCIHGGVSQDDQIDKLTKGVDVVGTDCSCCFC